MDIKFMKIVTPPDFKYVSMREQLYLDAQKYIDRAGDYLRAGKPEYAGGCIIKAGKKIEKAGKLLLATPAILEPMKEAFDKFQQAIEDTILNGNQAKS